ncbi:MAG TPA: methyltransferase domain-containing protein [Planctomycetota bacterium]|nr:methyltransferase domain-containing protein [Planctomycetota bacterium]
MTALGPTGSHKLDRSGETTAAGISWLEFARCRAPFQMRWPSVFDLWRASDHYAPLVRRKLTMASVLDVGATDRLHEAKARALWPGIDYRSLDIDRTNRHDYHSFDEVDRQFDLVTLIEVVEHVPPKVAVELMANCFRACRSGGHVLASVPNVFAPGVQHEWTHIAALHYMDIAGLVAWSGFEVIDLARVYIAGWKQRLLHARLLHALHRALGVDYAQSVVVLGRKP